MLPSFKHLFPLALALAAFTSPAAAQKTTTCAPLHMVTPRSPTLTPLALTSHAQMIGGGCMIPCPSDEAGLLSTLIGNITAAFPDADQYFVPYDGSQTQAAVSSPLMIAAANSYFASCPNTPVVFIGYSLGGIVVMNTLCGGINATYTPNVIAAIVSVPFVCLPGRGSRLIRL